MNVSIVFDGRRSQLDLGGGLLVDCEPGWIISHKGGQGWAPARQWRRSPKSTPDELVLIHESLTTRCVFGPGCEVVELSLCGDQFVMRHVR